MHHLNALELFFFRTCIYIYFLRCCGAFGIAVVQSFFWHFFRIAIFGHVFANGLDAVRVQCYCHGFDFQHMLDGMQVMGCGCYVGAVENDNVY